MSKRNHLKFWSKVLIQRSKVQSIWEHKAHGTKNFGTKFVFCIRDKFHVNENFVTAVKTKITPRAFCTQGLCVPEAFRPKKLCLQIVLFVRFVDLHTEVSNT